MYYKRVRSVCEISHVVTDITHLADAKADGIVTSVIKIDYILIWIACDRVPLLGKPLDFQLSIHSTINIIHFFLQIEVRFSWPLYIIRRIQFNIQQKGAIYTNCHGVSYASSFKLWFNPCAGAAGSSQPTHYNTDTRSFSRYKLFRCDPSLFIVQVHSYWAYK